MNIEGTLDINGTLGEWIDGEVVRKAFTDNTLKDLRQYFSGVFPDEMYVASLKDGDAYLVWEGGSIPVANVYKLVAINGGKVTFDQIVSETKKL